MGTAANSLCATLLYIKVSLEHTTATPNTLQLQETDRGVVLLSGSAPSYFGALHCCLTVGFPAPLESLGPRARVSESAVGYLSLSVNLSVTLRPIQGAAPPSRRDSWARVQHPTASPQGAG